MKKQYRKGAVHPSPQLKSCDCLSFLPATVLTLAAALSPEDREVLSYLISSASAGYTISSGEKKNKRVIPSNNSSDGKSNKDHPPLFHCDCFSCYMSFWARWDSSPNHHLIHEIIDAFEESCLDKNRKVVVHNVKKDRRNGGRKSSHGGDDEL